ncbi:MAG: DedA family protein [Propionibacteriaceae bacterium]|nr:DedA family protein [Propionibacteriaceae bacterium]
MTESAGADVVVSPDQSDSATAADEEEKPWYEQPGLPWTRPPTKADIACWGGIMVIAVYSVLVMIFRPTLITWSPAAAAAITGGRSSVVATGAFARVDGDPWWFVVTIWLVAAVSLVKFSWVYWWAGRLWGDGIIELWAGQTERARRRANRAVAITQKFWPLAVVLTFLPLPFPMAIVFAAIGAAGIRLSRFLIPVLLSSVVLQAAYLALGWWIGEPVVKIVDLIARYLLWITLAILVGTIVVYWRRESRKAAARG